MVERRGACAGGVWKEGGGDIRERALSGAVERGKKRAAPKREWRQGRAQE